MVKRISFIVFSFLLLALFTLNSSLNGRTAELPVGTYISLHFPGGEYKVTINPDKGIVEYPKYNNGTHILLPRGDIALLKVVGQGTAIISVTRVGGLINLSQDLAASQAGNWAGYETYTGPDTSITSNWVVPTAAYSSTASYSAQWIGIDDSSDANLDIIQVATESNYVTGISCGDYLAVYELYPSPPVTTSHTVCPGDSMYAKIYQISGSTWSITLNDLTQGWNFTRSVTYYGPYKQGEWIVEAQGTPPTTLANYGTTTFLNDTLNGANPNHNYSTDSIDMVYGVTQLSTTSQPNSSKNGFSVVYGSTAPSAPSTSWTNEGSIMTGSDGIYYHTATLLNNGNILIAGGQTAASPGNPTARAFKYTPCTMPCSSGSWTQLTNMNHSHKFHIMAHVTASGSVEKVLVAGGWQQACSCVQKKAELYDPSAGTWTDTPDMNQARETAGSSLLSDGTVFVTGGDSNGLAQAVASTEIYEPVANTWTSKASMSTARTQHQQVTFTDSGGNSKVMVMGGYNASSTLLKSTEIYDPSANSWSAGPNMGYARAGFSAVLLHDGRILVVGGEGSNYRHSEVYDPSANSWTVYTTPYNAYSLQAVVLGSGASYKVLGAGTGGSNNTMLFDPSANSWAVSTNMNTARSYFSLTALSDGNVLAAGGYSSGYSKSSEVYTP